MAQVGATEAVGQEPRPCKSDWMRRSAKHRPEARWRPAATGPLMVWKVSSVSMQSWLSVGLVFPTVETGPPNR